MELRVHDSLTELLNEGFVKVPCDAGLEIQEASFFHSAGMTGSTKFATDITRPAKK